MCNKEFSSIESLQLNLFIFFNKELAHLYKPFYIAIYAGHLF